MNVKGTISNRPSVDYTPAALALAAYLALHSAGYQLLKLSQDWSGTISLHQTLVEVSAGLFGLVFTAVAVLRALGRGRRLDHLQMRLSRELARNLNSVIRGLGLCTLVTVVAMSLDTSVGHPLIARAATVAVVALAIARIVRLLWVFNLVLGLSDRDAETDAAHRPGGGSPLNRLNPPGSADKGLHRAARPLQTQS